MSYAAMSDWPLVTAVIPTRDRPVPLRRALGGIMNQRYPGLVECVLVFDQQSPRVPFVNIPEGWTLRVIENARTPGLAGARNAGAAIATGEVLAWCDDDDEWLPDKLRLQIELLRGYPEAAAATCGIRICVGKRTFVRTPTRPIVQREQLLRSRQAWIHSSTLMVRRERFFGDVGVIDEEIPGSYGEDYEWILRAARVAKIVAVPQPLVRVYWQESYYSDRWETMIQALKYQIAKHPEIVRDPGNAARIYGRMAFAYSALGRRAEASVWAWRSMKLDWRQPRGYLAALVSTGFVAPESVLRLARAAGRGV